MKNSFIKLTILFVTIATVTACRTKSADPTPDQTLAAKITGNYKVTALSIKSGTNTTDVFAGLDACAKDDILQFRADKTYLLVDAGSQCSPSTAESGTWQVSNNKLVTQDFAADVVSYDGKLLTLSYSLTAGNLTSTVTEVLTRQ